MILKIFEFLFTIKLGFRRNILNLNPIYSIITKQLKGTIECDSESNYEITFLIGMPLENGGKIG
jgi:hypothetical protein